MHTHAQAPFPALWHVHLPVTVDRQMEIPQGALISDASLNTINKLKNAENLQ